MKRKDSGVLPRKDTETVVYLCVAISTSKHDTETPLPSNVAPIAEEKSGIGTWRTCFAEKEMNCCIADSRCSMDLQML